jgi:four helix bundle protein
MKTYAFEKLIAWQESRLLVKQIYKLSADFPEHEKFGLVSQIRRASVSVSSNLAEGSGRNSEVNQKYFYRISYSSLMEVLNQAILSFDLDYITDEQLNKLRIQIDKTAQLISGLVNSK